MKKLFLLCICLFGLSTLIVANSPVFPKNVTEQDEINLFFSKPTPENSIKGALIRAHLKKSEESFKYKEPTPYTGKVGLETTYATKFDVALSKVMKRMNAKAGERDYYDFHTVTLNSFNTDYLECLYEYNDEGNQLLSEIYVTEWGMKYLAERYEFVYTDEMIYETQTGWLWGFIWIGYYIEHQLDENKNVILSTYWSNENEGDPFDKLEAQDIYGYDEDGNWNYFLSQIWQNDGWVNDLEVTGVYDERGNLLMETQRLGPNLNNFNRKVQEFDERNNITLMTDQRWYLGDWRNYVGYTYKYDYKDNRTEWGYFWWELMDDVITASYIHGYHYDEQDNEYMQTCLIYDKTDQEYYEYWTSYFEYNDDNYLTSNFNENYYTNERFNILYEYDENNNWILEKRLESKSLEGPMDTIYVTVLENEGNNRTLIHKTDYANNEPVSQFKIEYEYDENDNASHIEYFAYSGGDWVMGAGLFYIYWNNMRNWGYFMFNASIADVTYQVVKPIKELPIVDTYPALEITGTEFVLRGSATGGDHPIIGGGFVYYEEGSEDKIEIEGEMSGKNITAVVTELKEYTTYYCQTYAETEFDKVYGRIVSFTTGETNITSNNVTSNINIYPNPAVDIIYIEGKNIETVEIFNVYGQSLKKVQIDNYREKIDISELPQGVYIFKVFSDKAVSINKVIKR